MVAGAATIQLSGTVRDGTARDGAAQSTGAPAGSCDVRELIERAAGLMPDEQRGVLVDELVRLRSLVNAAEARSGLLVAELCRLDDGHPLGCRSPVQFLGWQAGLSTGAAKALVAVGERLGELPSLHAAAVAGEVSLWQARAIAAAAEGDAEADALVGIAKEAPVAQLERACRHLVRSRRSADDRDRAAHRARRLRTWWNAEGRFRLDGELDAEEGALVASALDAAAKLVPNDALAEADDPHGATQADALGVLARSFLEPDRSGPCDGPPPGHLAVHVGVRRLTDSAFFDDTDDDDPAGVGGGIGDGNGHVDGLGDVEPTVGHGTTEAGVEDPALADLCRLGWTGVGVSDAMARRLGCDCTLQAVIRDPDGNPLALGRTQRVVNRRLRRAVLARDGGCVAQGCGARQFLHCHHVIHWADGGPTDLANLAALCTWHHRMVHDGYLEIHWDHRHRPTARLRPTWVRGRPPDPPPPIEDLDRAATHAGVTPEPDAARSHWTGERINWWDFDAAYLGNHKPGHPSTN